MRNWFWLIALGLGGCSASSDARVAEPAATAWEQISPQPARIDGRMFSPTCSQAPGADPAYRFWFKRGSTDGLVVFFDGGGACWDDITCAVPRRASDARESDGFYKAELIPGDDPNRLSGIFDLGNARNPVRDWSFVFVPYCTGDVHSGSNTAHYRDPDTGEPYAIEHRGSDNFRTILAWMRANIDAPARILVAGSSAGAYGAATHFARIRAAYPHGHAIMLGDAGQGVTTAEFSVLRNGSWRYQLPTSVFGRNAMLTADDDVVARLAAHFPRDRFAQYTTAQDVTQRAFFALMGPTESCNAWGEKMSRDLTHRQSAGNFRAYLAAGETHTIMRSPLFYSERTGGARFAEWLATLLSEEAPLNAACENCLAPPPGCRF